MWLQWEQSKAIYILLKAPPHWVLCTIRQYMMRGQGEFLLQWLHRVPESRWRNLNHCDCQLSKDSKEYGTLVSQSSTTLPGCKKHYPSMWNIKLYCLSLKIRNSAENYPAIEEFRVFSLKWTISVLSSQLFSRLNKWGKMITAKRE